MDDRPRAGGDSERHRLGVLAACLLGFVAAVSLAMMGARPIRPANRSASPQPGQTTSPVPVTAASRTIPPNFWTDYVQVDAIDGNTLRVHSTRHPDVTPPYDIVTDESTILQPAEGIFGPSPGIGPGTRLYFTGLVESGLAPAPRSVRALRLFEFEDATNNVR